MAELFDKSTTEDDQIENPIRGEAHVRSRIHPNLK
jgi:hypothetical protein